MTPQNPSMDQYVEPISRSTFRGRAQYKRELKSRNEWRRHHWTPQEAGNKIHESGFTSVGLSRDILENNRDYTQATYV